MGNLAYRSSKLGFRSSKLAYNNPWTTLTKSLAQYKIGSYGWQSNTIGFSVGAPFMGGWDPYPGGYFQLVDRVLGIFNSSTWTAGDAVARISAAHSHGSSDYGMKQENFFLYQEGFAIFSRPAGLGTITEARLWLGNAGEIFHTISDLGRYLWLDKFVGVFGNCSSGNSQLPYLNNVWLEIVISVSDTIYHVIQLSRGDLATLNTQQGNGKIAAGLGQYSYMYSSSIYLNMPAAVISMLNSYTGVGVAIYWNWGDAYLGPACDKCLHLDFCAPHDTSYSAEVAASATPWATRTSLARLGNMEAR